MSDLHPYQEYKESGVEWLGMMPSEWDVCPVKFVASYNDEVLGESTTDDTEITYVEISDVSESEGVRLNEPILFGEAPSRARRIVRKGDVLVSTVRTYLRAISAVEEDCSNLIASTGFAVLRAKTIAPEFLRFAMLTEYVIDEIISRSTGVSYPAINASDLVRIKIPVPSLQEQRAIASYLDHETAEIDAFIADQERLITLLNERRAATITQAVTKGLDLSVPMKSSGYRWLGQMPKAWDVRKLKSIVAVPITDGPHETPEILAEGVPFISAEAVSSGTLNFKKARGYISEADHARYSKKYRPQLGDIYMVKSGATTGVCAIVDTDEEFSIWSPLAAIRCGENALPRFVLHALRSRNFQESVALFWSYGTQQNIGMKVIENLPVPLPSMEEQRVIADYLDYETAEIDAAIADAIEAIQLSKERRATLISAAVTGKIDVRNHTTADVGAA